MNTAVLNKFPAEPLRVLLVDDCAEFLAAARRLLSTQTWARVVGMARSAAQALQLTEALQPQLVLMDIVMPGGNGIEATRAIKAQDNAPAVVVLSLHDNAEYRYHACEAGADGYVVKAELERAVPQLLETAVCASRRMAPVGLGCTTGSNDSLAKQALQQSEERLRLALEAGDMGIFDWDLRSGVVTWSPEHARLFGLRPDAFDGNYAGFARCVHPDDLAGIEQAIETARTQRVMYQHRHRVVWPDGAVHWIHGRGRFHYDSDGQAQRMTGVVADITERKHAEERLEYLAHHDGLTGLPNRLLFTDRLQQAMVEADRHQRLNGVAFLDLDRFQTLNDTLGSAVGDGVLRETARRLSQVLRPGDTVARFGGDEFAVLLADMKRAEDAPLVVRRILDAFEAPFLIAGRELFVTACLGITLHPIDDPAADAEALLCNADTALLRARREGRSGCQFYTAAMTQRAHQDMALEAALRHAIERDELQLHYQPIVDLECGRIRALEALLRWQHPKLGAVSPARFIPIAEESGLIVPIGDWVLRQACTQMQKWWRDGHRDLHVAVNMSTRQFREPHLAERVLQVLAEAGLEGRGLELELTESLLLTDPDATIALMQQLDAHGVRFAIDDFGTGYSSLSYLKRLPVDVLKIDQSFVREVPGDKDDAAIVRAIITMAHSLGLTVVAEGVEQREQLQFLTRNGADAMQGFYFCRPQPAHHVTRLLAAQVCLDSCELGGSIYPDRGLALKTPADRPVLPVVARTAIPPRAPAPHSGAERRAR